MSIATPAPINAEDICAGDTIRREQPDNPRVKAVEYVARIDADALLAGYPHFLLHRPAKLPTTPGVYLGEEATLWRLDGQGFWSTNDGPDPRTVSEYAPFDLLAPVAKAISDVVAEANGSFASIGASAKAVAARYGVTL